MRHNRNLSTIHSDHGDPLVAEVAGHLLAGFAVTLALLRAQRLS